MESTAKVPLSERINFRMLTFFVVLALLVGYPLWIYIDSAIHGGIKDAGGGYVEVDLKAMSVFPLDQINGTLNDVPEKWRKLDGRKIIAYGEMWQPKSASRYVDSFDLVYSIAKCCFSGPPQVQHFVHAKAVDGANLEYFDGLVKVTGTLHVDVQRDENKVARVYSLDVESIEQNTINLLPWLIGVGVVGAIVALGVQIRRALQKRRTPLAV